MAEGEHILIVNAGSSSIKFAVFEHEMERALHGEVEGIGMRPRLKVVASDGSVLTDVRMDSRSADSIDDLIRQLMTWLENHLGEESLTAIGHRVAIGGLEHSGPVIITAAVLKRLQGLVPLAPMHQPRNLEPIEILQASHPQIPQVACFDTAFHRTIPAVAERYGLPKQIRDAGAHRYGFHGISYEYIAGRLQVVDAQAAASKTVIAHLGNGSSMCALKGGRSVATTMGFSPLSGLIMGTRSGDLDPGLMIWLLREQGMSIDAVEAMLYHDSGLQGISGFSNDMRDLLASEMPAAKQAIESFVYKVSTELGALSAALEGLDALVFTAGIGENACRVRELICQRARWLGVKIDARENKKNSTLISADSSAIRVYVIPTNEERMIALHALSLTRKLPYNRQRATS
jgi:acetate kinase